jgi:hypothetical protein
MYPLFLLLLHLNFGPGNFTSIQDDNASDTLIWQPETKLNWDDFLAEAPSRNSFAAFTYTLINMEYSATITEGKVIPSFKIYAAFNRRRSWVKNQKEARTPEILAHEQAHFDISEITARRLRKALLTETYSRKSLEQKINSIYQVTVQAGDEMQALYDQESDHGLNKAQQLKWSNRVKNELSELANYER